MADDPRHRASPAPVPGPAVTAAGGSPAAAAPPKIYSVTQYNLSVERLLRAVPRVWVKGVITQLNVRGRLAYITLAEFAEDDAKPKAVLEASMWSAELEVFNLRFAQLPTPLALRVEMKVAFLLEAGFYVPSGRFRPRVIDIDENFTLGELSLTRQRILERLHKEGLLARNKSLAFSDCPLRVGLITAPGSAAYQDFVTVLLGSGFSFRIHFAGARMQGESAEATVVKALETLGRLPLDVICLVRGGGAKTDLVYFDAEAICRAIALCPVPVLTGIGHEIDSSLADLVAHANKITPTDCAKFLESRLAACHGRLQAHAAGLSEAWRMQCQQAWHDLGQRATALKHSWEGRRGTEAARCRERARGLSALARQALREEGRRLSQDRTGLLRGPRKLLKLERALCAGKWHRLKTCWTQGVFRGGETLALKGKLVHAADPARMLELGYSLTRDRNGALVKSLAQIAAGDLLTHQFRDGTAESRVSATRPDTFNRPDDAKKEPP